MKKVLVFCVLLTLWLSLDGSSVWAIDVGWMQKGVRVWYFGAAGTGMSSDAEEAYLFSAVNGNNVQVTKHSAINHWGSPNPVDTSTYSFLDKGPCWIHPQVLQTLQSGDTWKGQVIATVLPESHTYNTFKAQFSFPYLLLPIKALFDLNSQRNLVKIVYYIDQFSTGIAYFDADTGLLLLYETSNGFVTVFFLLSEINYDFATHRAFAEDNGPHTMFKSNIIKTSSASNVVNIQSSVETRYGNTVQMWVSTLAGGSINIYTPPNENYCFFGSVPVLRRKYMTDIPNYPPEGWNEYGEYLWWWVPEEALRSSSMNILNVPMTRTSTAPYTFAAAGVGTGLYFSDIIFDNAGYMTDFSARYPAIGLNIDLGPSASPGVPIHLVDGLEYYKNTMGRATPAEIKMVADFDGDGKTDIAVYRGNTGAWYIYPSGGGSPYGVGWGISTDVPVPRDYDGDGKTDIAIYRTSTGAWFVIPSSGAASYGFGWGGDATDKPVPEDYDGDEKIDYAVYRNGVWFVSPSGGGSAYASGWGAVTDKPVPGDYDGDGKTDVAVYRDGLWFVYPSGGGAPSAVGWGIATDKPVPGDYDGDAKTDFAIYRDGLWFVSPSGGGAPYAVGWGIAADKPVPGDYDGDRKTDVAVYRPSTGAWYIIPSGGASPYGMGWGGDVSDIPLTTNPD